MFDFFYASLFFLDAYPSVFSRIVTTTHSWTLTPKDNLKNSHVFGLLEWTHACKKTPDRVFNQEPSCCMGKERKTALPWSLLNAYLTPNNFGFPAFLLIWARKRSSLQMQQSQEGGRPSCGIIFRGQWVNEVIFVSHHYQTVLQREVYLSKCYADPHLCVNLAPGPLYFSSCESIEFRVTARGARNVCLIYLYEDLQIPVASEPKGQTGSKPVYHRVHMHTELYSYT